MTKAKENTPRLKVTEVSKRDRHWRDRQEKMRVYVDVQGEGIFENLLNRHDRPYKLYRKEVMPKVLEELGLPPETKFRWSQKAGCSCGCSPGFIVDAYQRVDVWATAEAADPENDADAAKLDDEPDQVRRVSRALQVDADQTMPMGLTDEGRQKAMDFMEEVDRVTSS